MEVIKPSLSNIGNQNGCSARALASKMLSGSDQVMLVQNQTRRFSEQNHHQQLLSRQCEKLKSSSNKCLFDDLETKIKPNKVETLKQKNEQQERNSSSSANLSQIVARLPKSVGQYVYEKATLTNCDQVYICDGSEDESKSMIAMMKEMNINIKPLEKYKNCWLVTTDPRDTARVESKTFICTRNAHDIIPASAFPLSKMLAKNSNEFVMHNSLGNWMHTDYLDTKMAKLLKDCMLGRTMYVIPFSMGAIGGKLSKIGIQLTDSPYVVASMHIMTRVSKELLGMIEKGSDFVKCFHSVGCPKIVVNENCPNTNEVGHQTNENNNKNHWPCNIEETIISHIPERNEIISYGSGYGGNSLLGKKCFALRFGTILGCNEGWLAEHMLIMSITENKTGIKKYIAAAFPSACGKTNLAMLDSLKSFGYTIKTAGDDIVWLRYDGKFVRGMNPEKGFFGVAPGTNELTNPHAMNTITKNTIFTNVASTSDGDFYWQGLEHKLENGVKVTSWLGNKNWTLEDEKLKGELAAHPNSRFCAPIEQCPIIDELYAEEVPISAILFGTRRSDGIPLIYESFNWEHGIYLGASMRSEATAAAEHKAKTIMHDPMAQRPFLGVKFSRYLENWISFGQARQNMPKIFHVNWFRKDKQSGKFLWPGFKENTRILDYIFRRLNGEQCAVKTALGLMPAEGAINMDGFSESDRANIQQLLSVDKQFWLDEHKAVESYLRDNEAPKQVLAQSEMLRQRLLATNC